MRDRRIKCAPATALAETILGLLLICFLSCITIGYSIPFGSFLLESSATVASPTLHPLGVGTSGSLATSHLQRRTPTPIAYLNPWVTPNPPFVRMSNGKRLNRQSSELFKGSIPPLDPSSSLKSLKNNVLVSSKLPAMAAVSKNADVKQITAATPSKKRLFHNTFQAVGALRWLAKGEVMALSMGFLSLSAASALESILPIHFTKALNAVLAGEQFSAWAPVVATWISVNLLHSFFGSLRTFYFGITGTRSLARLRATIVKALGLNVPLDDSRIDHVVSQLSEDTKALANIFLMYLNPLLQDVVVSIMGFRYLYSMNTNMAGMMLALISSSNFISLIRTQLKQSATKSVEELEAKSAASKDFVRALSTPTPKKELAEWAAFDESLQRIKLKQLFRGIGSAIGAASSRLELMIIPVLTLLYGKFMLQNQMIEAKHVAASFFYLRIVQSSARFWEKWMSIYKTVEKSRFALSILNEKPEKRSALLLKEMQQHQPSKQQSFDADQPIRKSHSAVTNSTIANVPIEGSVLAMSIQSTELYPLPNIEALGQDVSAQEAMKKIGMVQPIFDGKHSDAAPSQGSSEHNAIMRDSSPFSVKDIPASSFLKELFSYVSLGQLIALVSSSNDDKAALLSLVSHKPEPGESTPALKHSNHHSNDESLSQISYIPHKPQLFPISIRENIALTNKVDSEASILEAAKLANCHDFILKLPEGYDTVLGSNGYPLSTVQQQLVATARALLSKPKVLLFDEANLAVDSEDVELIREAFRRIKTVSGLLVSTDNANILKDSDAAYIVDCKRRCISKPLV